MNGEIKNTPPDKKNLTRRQVLVAAGAAGAAALLPGCGVKESSWGSFKEIGEEGSVLLEEKGKGKLVEIRYDPEMRDKIGAEHFLQERKSGDVPFGTETSTDRKLGEIIDRKLIKVEITEEYGDVNLHATGGKMASIGDRTIKMEPGRVYTAIRVATEAQDWTGEGTLPEYEKQHAASDHPGISKMSQGYAVGRLEGNIFIILGYVCDPRVIQEVQK